MNGILPRFAGSLHRFIISLAPTGVHFNEMHFVSFHFSERH